MSIRTAGFAATALTAILFSAGAAHATPQPACSVTDLSLTIAGTTYDATACATGAMSSPDNPSNATSQMNTALGTNFTWVAKLGQGGSTQGIQFTVSATSGNTGTWTVTWADTNPVGALTLPVYASLDVGLTGGSVGDAYEFTNLLLPASPTSGSGSFLISFVNKGGQNPGISDINLAVGNLSEAPVPEPATVALFGAGLMGLGLVRRARKS